MNMRASFAAMGRWQYGTRAGQRGFSFMELLIVLIIIGILLSIAVPAYNSYIMKARRSLAKTALMDLAQRQEKFYSLNNTYSSSAADLGYPSGQSFPLSIQSDGGITYYTIAAPTVNTATAAAPADFSAAAVPTAAQAADACGTFTINSVGVQSATGSGCW